MGIERGLPLILRRLPAGWRILIAFCAGAVTLLAFAPFSLFPLAAIGPALLFLLWLAASPSRAFAEGWVFGLGLLGFGIFWMHISIDQFGNVGTALAILITLAFVAAMALYYGAAGWLALRLAGTAAAPWRRLLIISALWPLSEWLRGWVLTGFPWLTLGYSQMDSPLAGWAVLLGGYGVSWALVLTAAGLVLLLLGQGRHRVFCLVGLALLWGVGGLLGERHWTKKVGAPIRVSIVQGNVPQEDKWLRDNLLPTLELYSGLTRQHWDSDLIIWPETAVPAFAHQVEEALLRPLEQEAREQGSELLIGIPAWEQQGNHYYNAMLSLGPQRGVYHKRHLVPFGEFMPLKFLLQPLIDWLQIPMSDFTAGDADRPLLTVAGYPAGISICYEDAFGEEVIQALPEAAFLVNASNDAWFGDSLAPPQHLEIARMRALETGRYLLRATNTGISALIGPRGQVLARSPAFETHVLTGAISPMGGYTPYAWIGNWAVVSLSATLLLLALALPRRRGEKGEAD